MMEDVIEVECNESEDSIVELELPKKPSPPLIYLEDDDIVLNVTQEKRECIMAEEFIQTNLSTPATSETGKRTETNVNSPNHWTSDMIKFYNDDWGDEDQFIVEKLQEKMDKSPFLWEISRKDILHMQNKFRRNNIRCWNCKQPGHNITMCPDPPYVPKCFMCGVRGHYDYCCPNAKCLNCGTVSQEYVVFCCKCRNQLNEVCSRCHLVGHNVIDCSDHWRLFHLTTNTTSVKIPGKNIYKSEKDMWCCNCGRKGHHQIQCLQKKENGGFRDTFPFIVSYQKLFADDCDRDKLQELRLKMRKVKRKENFKIMNNLMINPLHQAIRKQKRLKNRQRKLRRKSRKRKNQEFRI